MARRDHSAASGRARRTFAGLPVPSIRLVLGFSALLVAGATLGAFGGRAGHAANGPSSAGSKHHPHPWSTTGNPSTTGSWSRTGSTTTATGRTTTARTTTTTARTTTAKTTTAATTTAGPAQSAGDASPLHTGIYATTFWVGEIYDANAADGSQVCSTYDSNWALDWSGGVRIGTAGSGTGCAGSPFGGCDGVPSGAGASFRCATEARTAKNGYFPTSPAVHPAENPFYLDLPFDDVNDPAAFAQRCSVVPWASQYPAANCKNQSFSYLKNHWVKLIGPNGSTCYGQVEDAGPFAYDDTGYVFGATDARPKSKQADNAGLDVSPALNGCLGFKELDGDGDRVSWQFVDASQVPAGPWQRVVTTRGVS
jgi:hypothetical protein